MGIESVEVISRRELNSESSDSFHHQKITKTRVGLSPANAGFFVRGWQLAVGQRWRRGGWGNGTNGT
ncbi:hypothetical protein CKO51_16110 [Rhodopirellula sp. SM50]|nr:hypothetical protein CKO51_16110 [Rhodopirellula sp. SM50]